jgi:hypothetical protein
MMPLFNPDPEQMDHRTASRLAARGDSVEQRSEAKSALRLPGTHDFDD